MKHDDSPNDAQGKAHIADEPIAHDALVRARESLDALLAHERTTGAASKGIEVRARVFNEALHLHIWWTGVSSRMGTEFLWDDLCVKPGGPELMQSLRQALEGTSVGGRTLGWKDLDPGQIVRPTAEPPMFRYEPQRVRTQLPFGKRLAQLARVPGVAHDGESFVQVSQAGLKELGNVVFSSMGPMARLLNPGPQSSVRARTRSLDTDPTGHQDAIRCFTEFVRFEAAGRHIFDFPDRLSAMFRRTDVEDMPGELLKLPYKAFYMCFGPQPGLEIRPGWFLDGAYVSSWHDGSLSITVTAAPPDVTTYKQFETSPEPSYSQLIPAKHLPMPLGEAVELALASDMNELRKVASQEGSPEHVQLSALAKSQGLEVQGPTPSGAPAFLAEIERRHPLYLEMLRLVINGMLYPTAYPDDTSVDWPEKAPEKLRGQVQDDRSPKKKRNAESKLMAMGYTAIHFCGQHLDEPEQGISGRQVPPGRHQTWQKGFWQRHAHGQGRVLRRLVWHRPQMVLRAGEGPAEGAPGHLYLVS